MYLRRAVIVVAALEFVPAAWLLVRIGLEVTDRAQAGVGELLWIAGLLGLPSLLALILAVADRGLGCAIALCAAYALVCLFFLAIAQTATVAG